MHVAVSVLCGPTGGPATYGKRLVAALAASAGYSSTTTELLDHGNA